MATLSKHLLSESNSISGRRVVVSSTAANSATILHVTPSTSNLDECWIYAHNYGSTDLEVTFLWGLSAMPSASASDVFESVDITIPFKSGRALVFDGSLLYGGLSAAAYCTVPNSISIDGFVNRITS